MVFHSHWDLHGRLGGKNQGDENHRWLAQCRKVEGLWIQADFHFSFTSENGKPLFWDPQNWKAIQPLICAFCAMCACTRADLCVRAEREKGDERTGVYSKKGPRSVDPNHQPLGDTARLRELGPLPDHVIICTYAVTTLTTLSCSELYSNNFNIFSQALETGSERKTAQ
jgi:hypothetical protein